MCVLNDESHHCYLPEAGRPTSEDDNSKVAREITDSAERVDVLRVVVYTYATDTPADQRRIKVARAQMKRALMIRELTI